MLFPQPSGAGEVLGVRWRVEGERGEERGPRWIAGADRAELLEVGEPSLGTIVLLLQDGVVDGEERVGFEGVEENVGSFALVVSEEALVEPGGRRNGRLIAEEDGEEFKRGNVAAHDDETDR